MYFALRNNERYFSGWHLDLIPASTNHHVVLPSLHIRNQHNDPHHHHHHHGPPRVRRRRPFITPPSSWQVAVDLCLTPHGAAWVLCMVVVHGGRGSAVGDTQSPRGFAFEMDMRVRNGHGLTVDGQRCEVACGLVGRSTMHSR